MRLTPDTIIQDRYRIEHLIAQGGMGAVYQATDRRLGNTVAMKHILLGEGVASEQAASFRKAFEREARLLANLNHPSLPSVSDYFAEETGEFLVMQFIPGDDLGTMLERDKSAFTSAEGVAHVLQWVDQLLDVLDYLHRQQPPVIHRDIKPKNLKPTAHGDIILLDFGIAKGNLGTSIVVPTMRSVQAYTVEYAPLEQVQGSGTDPRSDLYALAATLHHLLTGTPPPDALTRAAAMLSGQPDPLRPVHELNPHIPTGLSVILHQAMEPRVLHRFTRAKAMRTAIHAAIQSSSVQQFSHASDLPSGPAVDSSGQSTIVAPPSPVYGTGGIDTRPIASVPPPPSTLPPLQQVLVVASDEPDSYHTITEALDQAEPGMRILVRPGRYTEQVILDKPVEIVGDGPAEEIVVESTNITPYAPTPCIIMQTEYALVRGLTLLGTQGQDGEKPASTVEIAQGRLVLEACNITESEGPLPFNPTACIRIHGEDTNPIIWRCQIHHGKGTGISIYNHGRGTIEECEIFSNAGAGVEIKKAGQPVLRKCRLHHGEKQGVLVSEQGCGILEACEIFANDITGVEIRQGSNPFLSECKIFDQTAGYGVYVRDQGTGILEGCEIYDNGQAGIGITQGGAPFVRQCSIHDCRQWGIFVWKQGAGLIEGCEIFANVRAGISIAQGGKPSIKHCRIHSSKQVGVLVWERGVGAIEACAIFANAHAGVSIMQESNPVIRRCAINRNGIVAVLVRENGGGRVEACDLTGNARGTWYIEDGSKVRRAGNRE